MQHMMAVLMVGEAGMPERKMFKPKFDLPELGCYRQPAPAAYWEKFPKAAMGVGVSLINACRLRNIAHSVGCSDWDRLELVCKDLTEGADIGCEGGARAATRSKNAPTAYEFPRQVSDAIAQWVEKGYAFGPVPEEKVPSGVKVNGIMCREKPNGSVRIILNLSAPEGRSVNDGIVAANFPAAMASTSKWLGVLHRAGRGGLMTKLDWADAYKHVHVREEDVKLQWFSWAGMFFAEKCLVFGGASSPGIYDRAAKTVLDLVLRWANFPAEMVCQLLDDVCAAAAAGSEGVYRFEKAYRDVAKEIGVRLAGYEDSEKAFAPCTKGVVLGVEYDTVAWTWAIPQEKLIRLVAQIKRAMAVEEIRQDEMWSLAGRIIHSPRWCHVGSST
jgi:hypothetical protein